MLNNSEQSEAARLAEQEAVERARVLQEQAGELAKHLESTAPGNVSRTIDLGPSGHLAERVEEITSSGVNTKPDHDVEVDPQIREMYNKLQANPLETLKEWIGNTPKSKGPANGQPFNDMTEALREHFKDVQNN